MAVPYHTHTFEIPTATDADVAAGVRSDVAVVPSNLGTASQSAIGDFATAAQGALASTAVQPSRSVGTGTGLTGGGDLSANRTIALNASSVASLALADTAVQPARLVGTSTGLLGGGNLSADRTISLDLAPNVRDYLDVGPYVADRTALKALDTTKDTVAFLKEAGREGAFIWRTGNFSSQIAADTREGIYIKADAIASSAGAWVRHYAYVVNVQWFGTVGDNSTDDTAAIQTAINIGVAVYFPKPAVAYKATGLTVSTQGQSLFGEGYASYINAATGVLFTVTGSNVNIRDFRLKGGYVAGNQAIYLNNASQCKISGLDMREFDVFVRWANGGFHTYMTDCHTRNVRTYGIQLDDGVGFFASQITYDTDGVWNGGSFAEPTAFYRISNEGNVITDIDLIHAAVGILIEPNGRNIEWNKFSGGFPSDSAQAGAGSGGLVIRQSSNTHYIRGQIFDNCWFATNNIGVLIDGSGTADVDGIDFIGCQIHNNRNEGARITASSAKNISFKTCSFAGNATAGTANNIYINNANGVQFDDCFLGRKYRWTSTPIYHFSVDTAATNVSINGCEIDANVSSGKFNILNGANTSISFDRWTELRVATIGGSVANVDVSDNSLGCFSQITVAFDNIAHASTGDLNLSFSDDAGATFEPVAFQRLQFTTGAEGYATTVSGGRSLASGTNIQGSYKFENLNNAYKHFTYNSNQNAASGQGLMLIGTVTTLNVINFLRFAWSAGNLTGGTIRVFVR